MDLLICIAAVVSVKQTQQLLRKVRHKLAQIPSTMGDQAEVRSIHRVFAMTQMLHHLSVVLLLVTLVLFLYNISRAAAISLSALAIWYLVARIKQTNCAYLRSMSCL
jgi:hypothetical protein